MKTIVSDTSPLVAFAFLHLEGILPRLLGEIIIPTAVAREIAQPRFGFDGVQAETLPGIKIQVPSDLQLVSRLRQHIDEGEAESLALAIEIGAELVVVDDAAARQAATELGLTITGTVGLLLRAKAAGHIPLVRPLLDQLREQLRFFLAQDLYERALAGAGE